MDENLLTKKYFIASRPYHYDYLTWCVQKRKPIPLWQNIFHLCNDFSVYGSVFVVAVFLIAVEYYLIQFEHPVRTWNELLLITLCAALGMPVAFYPRTTALRMLFVFGTLAGFMFATILSATVMRQITSPILRSQVQSIDEIISGNFRLVGDRYAFIKMSQQNQVKKKIEYFFHGIFLIWFLHLPNLDIFRGCITKI